VAVKFVKQWKFIKLQPLVDVPQKWHWQYPLVALVTKVECQFVESSLLTALKSKMPKQVQPLMDGVSVTGIFTAF
jgi:hypothetical protein